jgi:two-component system, sensor histidine kinase and response regulator
MMKTLTPDVIICDVQITGYEGVRLLAGKIEPTVTALIVILQRESYVDAKMSLYSGADDILARPFRDTELFATINKQLQQRDHVQAVLAERMHELTTKIAYALPHEFRTPLNGLIGFIGLLRESGSFTPDELPGIVAHLESSARRLYRTAEKFLLYAELERFAAVRAETHENFVTFDAAETTRDVATETVIAFERYEDTHFESTSSAIPAVAIKGQYLRFVVAEVVTNACKFSEHGTAITVEIENTETMFILTVRDNGRGIAPDLINTIGAFNQFEREEYEQQGLGFGLAIIKKIVHVHKGTFSIASTPDAGTSVRIALPLCATTAIEQTSYFTMHSIH